MLKTVSTFLIVLVAGTSTHVAAQNGLQRVDALVESVEIDSLRSYIRSLSGVDSISVSDSVLVYRSDSLAGTVSSWFVDTTVALDRRFHVGNEVAAYWLKNKLQGFGYEEVNQSDPVGDPWMQNIWTVKQGTTQPDTYYILCAHYDGVQPQMPSDTTARPAADDNASGTAAVLEASRLLAGVESASSIIFALWDSEEVGLDGSRYFATRAADEGMNIAGVVNLDMIGWDGDADRVVEIHADQQSALLAGEVSSAVSDFGLELVPDIYLPGARNSDHASFWNQDFRAVMLIEELRGGDFNPRYHQEGDRLEYLDLMYLRENARLALGIVARLAGAETSVGTEPWLSMHPTLKKPVAWPSPFSDEVHIRFETASNEALEVKIFDVAGRQVGGIISEPQSTFHRTVAWRPPSGLANGIFLFRVAGANSESAGSGLLVLAR